MMTLHSKKTRKNKRSDAENRQQDKALIREQALKTDPIRIDFSEICNNRENRTCRHTEKGEAHENKSWRRCILSITRANRDANEKGKQQEQEQGIAQACVGSRIREHHCQMQQQDRQDFRESKWKGGEHPGHSRPEKAQDKSAEQTVRHNARVILPGIRLENTPEIQWPEHHAYDSRDDAGGKKDSKRFLCQGRGRYS